MIDVIISKSTVKDVIESINEKINQGLGGQSIKDIRLVDQSDEVVILISTEQMNQQVADAFWLGYKRALE